MDPLSRKSGPSSPGKQPSSPDSSRQVSGLVGGPMPGHHGPYPPQWAAAYGWNGPMPPPHFMRGGGMDWMGRGMPPHGRLMTDY